MSLFCKTRSVAYTFRPSLLKSALGIRAFSVSSVQHDKSAPIGFIGLGNMGAHMARNLIKNGHRIVVHDKESAVVKDVVSSGATSAESPAEVAANCSTIITMLPATQHVQEVYLADNGIMSKLQQGSLLIDSSTIDPAASVEMAKEAACKKSTYLDCPVSGGVVAARDALLTFMVGGDESGFQKAKPHLETMGKNVIYCGASGNGQAVKICNNMLLAISMIGTSETMNLGTRLGLDPKLLAKILNMSTGRCWSSELYNPYPGVVEGIPASNGYEGGFGTALMAKDLGLAQNAAISTKAATPMGSLAHQIYRLMCNSGLSEKDFASAFVFLQEMENKKA